VPYGEKEAPKVNSGIRSLAKELTDALERELSRQEAAPAPAAEPAELFDLLVSVLADRVALELQSRQNGHEPSGREGLLNLAKRIRNEAQSSRAGDSAEQAEGSAASDSRFDIRDQSPKYANIESLLRYDETRELGPGVKLVIMNFND
jgi:hypothetical protein